MRHSLTPDGQRIPFHPVGERMLWRGRRWEVIDVAPLSPTYEQVVLRDLDRRRLPLSLASDDLVDARRV